MNKICNIFYLCYRSNFKNNTEQKALGIVLFFIFLSQIVSAQNPISGNQGFQILSEGDFTFTNGTHVHAPLAVGGNLILNTSSFASINMDGVGSYIFPGDGSTTTSLLVKGGITWSNGYASVLGTKYIHIGSSTGSASGDNGNNSNTQVYPSGKSYNNSKRIENTIDQTPNPAVFQTVTTSAFDFTTVFNTYRTNSTNLSNCTANVQLQTSSGGGNITNNVVSSSQTVYINSLITGVNYLNLTTTSLNNINGITFNVRPSASKVLIINVPITANFVWNNSNMAGLAAPADAPFILWNFYGANTFNLTINTASQIVGSVFAPNQNLIKTGTGDIEGNLIAETISLGTGEIHNYQFNGSAAGCLICSNVTGAGSIGTSQIACGVTSYDPTVFTELTAPVGGSGAFEYQWQSSTNNSTFTDISGATEQTYDAPIISATTYYRRGVRRIACTTYLYSSSISVTLTETPSAPTATNTSRCGTGTVSLSASGCAGTYNWYAASTGGSSLGTGASFTTPSISSTTTYYVDCTVNSCVSARSSATATILSTTTPTATVISTGCSGSLGSITATNLPNGYATNINGGAWTTSKNSYTDLDAGTYSIGYQGGGCNTYANFTVSTSTDNPLLSLVKTDPTCTTTGNITVTGSGGTTGLGSATYELWQGISGTVISNLTTNANYPNLPSSSTTLGILEGYTNAYDGFGGRISGYIVPPTTGTYYFWIASDDDGELWLSTNSSTANKSLIANISGWTNSRQWNKYSTQKSVAISLVAGQIYYFEALYKEGGGGDNIAIGWAKPGEATTTPSEVIPGKYVRTNVTSSTTTPVYQYKINSGSFQASNVFSGLPVGTYTLTIMDAGGCTATSTITLTTSGSVSAPTTTGTNRCSTGTVTLSASGCAGIYNWYAATTGGASLGTSASYTTPSISSTTTYYVDCTIGTCVSSRASAIATINVPQPSCTIIHNAFTNFNNSDPASTATTLWVNVHTKLTGQLTSNGDYLYFNAGRITLTNVAATWTTANIPDGKIIADNTVSTPVTYFDIPTSTWITKVPLNYSSSDIFISGAAILSSSGYVVSSGKNSQITANFYSNRTFSSSWFYGLSAYQPTFTESDVAALGVVNAIANGTKAGTPTNQTGDLVPGGSGGGGSNYTGSYSSTDSFTACSYQTPPSISNNSIDICVNGTADLTALGCTGTVNWYNNLGSNIGSGVDFTTPNISNTTLYYADCTDNTCNVSPKSSISVVVYSLPAAPTGVGGSNCGTGTVNLSASGCAGTYNWYAASTGGVSLGTGVTYTTPSISSTTTYYVDCTENTCVSATRSTAVATIKSIPLAPTGIGASRCGTGTVSLSASGCAGTYTWYAASAGGSSLGTGGTFTTPSILSTTTYYVDCTVSGCASVTRSAATATVIPLPSAPTGTGASRCGTGTVSLSASGCAGTYNWYAASIGGASLGTGSTFTTPSISSTTTYYVDCTVNTCVSATRSAAIATILIPPTATATNSGTACLGTTIQLVGGGNGVSFSWTGPNGFSSNLKSPLVTGATTSMGGVYTLIATAANGCTATATTNVTVNASCGGMCTNSLSAFPTNPTSCAGTNGNISVNEGNTPLQTQNSIDGINWYSSGKVYSSLGVGTYTVFVRDITSQNICKTYTLILTAPSTSYYTGEVVTPATGCTATDGSILLQNVLGTDNVSWISSVNRTYVTVSTFTPTNTISNLAAGQYYVRVQRGSNAYCYAERVVTVGNSGTPCVTGLCSSGNVGNNLFQGGDFGSGSSIQGTPLSSTETQYGYVSMNCNSPNDGNYSIINTTDCNGTASGGNIFGSWNILTEDHTPDDVGGYMMVVNASYNPDVVIERTISNLCPNTEYEYSLWIYNICPVTNTSGCPIKPNLTFLLDGVGKYSTGPITTPGWQKVGFVFTTGNSNSSIFSIRNNATGGNGNDWIIDDISITQCLPTIVQNSTNTNCPGSTGQIISATITDPVQQYGYYKWQKSTNNGITWSDVTSATTGTFSGNSYIATYNLPSPITIALNGTQYRVMIATTSTNLSNVSCSIIGQVTTLIVSTIVATPSANQSICLGSSETITASGSGGTAPYTYSWSNGLGSGASKIVTPLSNTTYTVTIIDANGCSATATVSISVVSPTPSITGTTTICNTQSTTLTAAGGNYYLWNNGSTSASITVNPPSSTNYTVTVYQNNVTNTNLITNVINYNASNFNYINSVNSYANASALFDNVDNTGGATFHASRVTNGLDWGIGYSLGGSFLLTNLSIDRRNDCCTDRGEGGVMQIWRNGVMVYQSDVFNSAGDNILAATPTPNVIGDEVRYVFLAGVNTLNNDNILNFSEWIIGGTKLCTASSQVTVTVNPLPAATLTNQTICNGKSAILTPTGVSNTSSYSWNTGATSSSISVSPSVTTTYTLTMTSVSGCTSTATVSVIVNPLPAATLTNQTICNGQSATLTPTGVSNILSYSWSTGATSSAITVSPSTTTTYTLVMTSSLGCTSTATVSVTVNPLPSVTATSNTPIIGGTLNLGAVGTGSGTTSYSWTGPNSFTSSLKTVSIAPVTAGMADVYTVTFTANVCTATATTQVVLTTDIPGGIDCSLIPTLSFTSPTLISGTAGEVNAQYRFSNITGGTDAIITILTKSHSDITIVDIDIPAATYGGFDAAMQPIIDYNWINGDGTFDPASEKSVTFKIDFVDAGTTNPKSVPTFIASGIDIDGSVDEVREFVQTSGFQSHQVESPTSLTLSGDLKATGAYTNFTGINELAKDANISFGFVNQSSIIITYGAEFNGNTANFVDNTNPNLSDERRLNSLYFKCENLNTTVCDVVLAAPTGTPASRCGTGTVTLEASGCSGIYQWYNSATGGTSIGTSNTFITSSITSSTTYYVECDAVGCISNRTTVIATINTIPSAPLVSSNSICGPGAITLSGSNCTGGTISWFNSQSGGTAIGTGNSFTTATLTTSAVYFASCTSTNNCVSTSRNYGVATINPIPEAILMGINSLCLGYQASNNGKLLLNKFETSDLFSYNIGSNYNSGTASAFTAIPTNGEILNSIADPSTNITYTVRIKNEENCIIDRMVTLTNQCSFCPAGYCEPANIIKTK